MSRPEVRRRLRMTAVEAAALLELLSRRSTVVTPTVRIARSRDPDDDKFLECAVAGGADYLVSADADLLSLRQVERIPVDIPTFWPEARRRPSAAVTSRRPCRRPRP